MIAPHLRNYWFAICLSSDISKKLVRYNLFNVPFVVFRDQRGQCKAYIDSCPHRGVPLSIGKLKNDEIICAYHGWRFDNTGKCKEIPALRQSNKACIKSISLLEKNGFVFATLAKNPHKKIPLNSVLDYYRFYWKQPIEGDIIDILENFLDATHTPYVHNRLIRSKQAPKKIEANLQRSQDYVKITYANEDKQSGLISRLFEGERAYSEAIFEMPSTAEINYYNHKELTLKIRVCLTPIENNKFNAHIFFYLKKKISSIFKYYIGYPFFYWALRQDINILRAQFENKFCTLNRRYIVHPKIDLARPHIHDLIINNDFSKNIIKSSTIFV